MNKANIGVSDILQMVDEALATRGDAKPNWQRVLKFKLTDAEAECLHTWRRQSAVIDRKLAETSRDAVAKLTKGNCDRVTREALDTSKSPLQEPFGMDKAAMRRAAKTIRTRLKEAQGKLNTAIGHALMPAGERLREAALKEIGTLEAAHAKECERLGLPNMPNGLVAALKSSLAPLERGLQRGGIFPTLLEQFVPGI